MRSAPRDDVDERPLVEFGVRLDTLHVDWHPDTIATLCQYAVRVSQSFSVHSDDGGGGDGVHGAVSGPRTPSVTADSFVDVSASVVRGMALWSPTGVVDPQPTPSQGAAGAPPVPGAGTIASAPACAVRARATFVMRQLSLCLHKEQQRRRLLRVAASGMGLSWEDRGGESVLKGSLGGLHGIDLTRSDTVFPAVLESAVEEDTLAGDGGDSKPVMSFSLTSRPPNVTADGVTTSSTLQLHMGAVRLVYLHQLWMEVVDFVSVGILGTLVFSAAQSAGELVAAKAREHTALDVCVVSPTLVLPYSCTASQVASRCAACRSPVGPRWVR
jgi:hypothetical protein